MASQGRAVREVAIRYGVAAVSGEAGGTAGTRAAGPRAVPNDIDVTTTHT